jgi:hypothetical protein
MCVFAVPGLGHADSISTLPEFNGPEFVDPGPYLPPTVVGNFMILPGDTAITISGTFGNSLTGSTAGVDLYLGSILVAQCVQFTPCYNNLTKIATPWSTTLGRLYCRGDIAVLRETGRDDADPDQPSHGADPDHRNGTRALIAAFVWYRSAWRVGSD